MKPDIVEHIPGRTSKWRRGDRAFSIRHRRGLNRQASVWKAGVALMVASSLIAACGSSGSKSSSSPSSAATGTTSTGSPSPASTSAYPLTGSRLLTLLSSKLGALKPVSGSTTRGIHGKTITIGGVAQVTSDGESVFPGMCDGAAARFARANRSGGVNGYKINYVGCKDDGGSPSTDNQEVQALVEEKKVFAIVPMASLVENEKQYLNQAHVPYFGYGLDPDYCGWSDDAFAISPIGAGVCTTGVPGYSFWSSTILVLPPKVAKLPLNQVKLAIVNQQTPGGQLGISAEAATAKALGEHVVYAQAPLPGPTSPQLTDYSPLAHQILSTGANFLNLAASGSAVVALAAALKAQGYHGIYQQFVFVSNSSLQSGSVADALNGTFGGEPMIGSTVYPTAQLSQVATDLKAIRSSAPVDGLGTLSSYAAADMFLAALAKLKGPLTAESLTNLINAGFDYPGISGVIGPISYPGGHIVSSAAGALVRIDGATKSIQAAGAPLGVYGPIYAVPSGSSS